MKRRTVLTFPLAVSAATQLAPFARATTCATPGLGRGFHMGELMGRTIDDYREMAEAGANLVRFGITLPTDKAESRYTLSADAIAELMKQLGYAQQTGIRLVLVLRPQPEPQAPLWRERPLQDSLDEHWRVLTRKLLGHPAVAAFDLINESHPPGLTFAAKEQVLDDITGRLIRTVRAIDPSRKIVFEPSPGARPMAFNTVNKLPFENIVYSVHMYEPFEFTHQGAADTPAPDFHPTVDYPGPVPAQGYWDRQRLMASLMPVKQFADRQGVEIYVGEFGAIRRSPGASRQRYLKDLTSIFQEWGWSWTFHAWKEWHGWDAQMGSDFSSRTRSRSEPAFDVIRQALQYCESAVGKR